MLGRLSESEIAGVGMTSQRTRDRLIDRLRAKGIGDERVLDIMRRTPRHLFMDEALATRAYEDTSLPIGYGQTISQPFVVALMTEALLAGMAAQRPRVLELGTGSGYQAAVLSGLVERVYTVERIGALLEKARQRFRQLNFGNVETRHADGHVGWPEAAPFDGILVTAAAESLPPELFDQVGPDGCLVAPVGGTGGQELIRYRRDPESGEIRDEVLDQVSFVPFLGGRS
ncbi:MAG: protein-L-isoaspartate(D-aspartate) O-methyltransferase [Halofilum sp. (in: g-proteobacteria)]